MVDVECLLRWSDVESGIEMILYSKWMMGRRPYESLLTEVRVFQIVKVLKHPVNAEKRI